MDVVAQVQTALANSPIYVLRCIRVERDGQRLVLSGSVDTYYHKQLVQEVVRVLAPGLRLVNVVEVNDQPAELD
jgi:hypothetical protein